MVKTVGDANVGITPLQVPPGPLPLRSVRDTTESDGDRDLRVPTR